MTVYDILIAPTVSKKYYDDNKGKVVAFDKTKNKLITQLEERDKIIKILELEEYQYIDDYDGYYFVMNDFIYMVVTYDYNCICVIIENIKSESDIEKINLDNDIKKWVKSCYEIMKTGEDYT